MKHKLRQWYYRVCLFMGIYKSEDFVTAYQVVNKSYEVLLNMRCKVGLCVLLSNALDTVAGINTFHPSRYISKFTKRFLGAPKEESYAGYWWPELNREESYAVRLEALRKLCDYYIEHDELILKGKRL